ncbi:MAG: thrombospondin type 3 repeat-containing protein [Myxococcota bacterium]
MIGTAVVSLVSLLLVEEPKPWIERVQPARDTWELGVHGGAFVLAEDHDLYDTRTAPQQRLRRVGPLAGFRGAYFPLSFVGAEAEFDGVWTELSDGSEPVFAWGARGHAILQLPLYRIVPFVFGGYGIMGVRSSRDAVGNDVDPVGHYGVGAKVLLTPWIAVRIDGRHMMSAAAARRRTVTHHGSVTLGLSFTLGRARQTQAQAKPEPEPVPGTAIDTDYDGVTDVRDRCPQVPGAGADGCVPADSDGDGILDSHDLCPNEAGTNRDGCLPKDADGDGIVEPYDLCPDVAGPTSDGCLPPEPEPACDEPLVDGQCPEREATPDPPGG